MTDEAWEALLVARTTELRLELAKQQMQLVKYRLLLEENGIEPPDTDADELIQMWRDCRAVITTASEFVARLGSAKELLADDLRKPHAA